MDGKTKCSQDANEMTFIIARSYSADIDTYSAVPYSIWKGKRSRTAKKILKNQAGRLILLDLKIYFKATVMKTM